MCVSTYIYMYVYVYYKRKRWNNTYLHRCVNESVIPVLLCLAWGSPFIFVSSINFNWRLFHFEIRTIKNKRGEEKLAKESFVSVKFVWCIVLCIFPCRFGLKVWRKSVCFKGDLTSHRDWSLQITPWLAENFSNA